MRPSHDLSATVSSPALDGAVLSRTPAAGEKTARALGGFARDSATAGMPAPGASSGAAHAHPHGAVTSSGMAGHLAGHHAANHRGMGTDGRPSGFSLLRLSLAGRLMLAAALLLPLWAAVYLAVG